MTGNDKEVLTGRDAQDERDLRIIEAAGPDPDLEGLVDWAAENQAYPDTD